MITTRSAFFPSAIERKGDPSKKIADVENIEIVFKDGIGYDSQKLLDSVKGRYGDY